MTMSRTAAARLAGFMFLAYIATGIAAILAVLALATFMWLPMLVFEVTLALWLLIKGVAEEPPC